ncbi:hypothetical protein AVEN_149230-1 [Araneus ventricosus]|uniref:Uncharacterized protein n=1 Tax=Araneus ventricosus TaxID=182803 RepID=A0A4Y2SUG8_ARAVE|nr:hypothetical protein AVEN_149230-1 [Araneus ventricosus]
MLQIYMMPILKETMHEGFVFQQNGAPCHFHNEVTSYLNAEVPVWIGRGGVIPWPARSPDFTPLDQCIEITNHHCARFDGCDYAH